MCDGTFKDSIFSAIFTNLPQSILSQPAMPLLQEKQNYPQLVSTQKKPHYQDLQLLFKPLNLTVRKQKGGKKNPPIFNLFAQGVALPWKDGR